MYNMYSKKVMISGVNTSRLEKISNEEFIELFKRYKGGDEVAKNKLVMANLRLVLSLLKRFNVNDNDINDMFQIGCIGLMKAVENFDLSFGVKFSTYAVPLIIGEMKRATRDSGAIRVSRGIKDLAYQIINFSEKYFNLYGVEPSSEVISQELGIEEYLIAYAMNSLKDPVSIYTPIYNDGGDTIYLLDQIEAKEKEYDKEMLISLKKAIGKLKEREQKIIYYRYMVGKTQTELSVELGISQAQVSRIEKTALENIKRMVK